MALKILDLITAFAGIGGFKKGFESHDSECGMEPPEENMKSVMPRTPLAAKLLQIKDDYVHHGGELLNDSALDQEIQRIRYDI